jgi:diguanylate cyclase (GGDEF)-like protein
LKIRPECKGNTIVVELTFIIAVLNIGLGFALAAYLGYGPPGLADTWGSVRRYCPNFPLPRFVHKRRPEPPPLDLPPEPAIPSGLLELFDAGEPGELGIEPCDEPYDDDAAELLNPTIPELWDLNEKYVEASVLRLNVAMIRSGARAAEIDSRLRSCRGQSDHETIETCLRLLREDCVGYLAEQSAAAKKFSDRIGELGELSSLGEEIEMGNFEQSAQVETTLNNLDYMDFNGDPEDGNRRLLEEIKNLGAARHRLRDKQEAAFLAIARCEGRIDKIEKQLFDDPLTKLPNRIGLEAELDAWWKQGRWKTRPMSAVLFDADRFGAVNENHGLLLADRILYQIGQILKSGFGEENLLARYAGNRFLAVLLDVGPRAAVKSIERMRQTVEKTTFLHENQKIKITVGAAIAEVKPDDDEYIAVLDRLEKTMKTVKESGPNRAFLHDGSHPESVASPNLGAEGIEIVI